MEAGAGATPPARLVEREEQLAVIGDALIDAAAGEGRLVLLEGTAGIGKTSLLGAGREMAKRRKMLVARARGAELELEFPYGVVRQLLEPVLRESDHDRRARLLSGAAALAHPALVEMQGSSFDPTAQVFSVVHGLYWLAANIAAETPLALLVDDAHWADTASLRFLAYLAGRLSGVTVAIIASVRTGDAGSDNKPLAALQGSPGSIHLSLSPLSEAGVATVLATEMRSTPDAEFVRATVTVTGGNPFFIGELARALRSDEIEPVASSADRILSVGPQSVARVTLARLGRLSSHAVVLARAIAVLGKDALLPRAAALTGLSEVETMTALDALVAADVIPATNLLEFRHPIVRTAVYEDMGAGNRSNAHRRASDLLAAEGADLDTVASHLLLCRPIGSPERMDTLRRAAHHALTLGAPDVAATYLQRALEECPEREMRAEILLDLGRTALLAGTTGAGERFNEVVRLSGDPAVRAAARIEKAQLLAFRDDANSAVSLLEEAVAELTDGPERIRLRAESLRAALSMFDPSQTEVFVARLPQLQELASSGRPGTPSLAFVLAWWAAQRDDPTERVDALAEIGWDAGRCLESGQELQSLMLGISALVACDRLDRAEEMVAQLGSSARSSGALTKHVIASALQAYIDARRGLLSKAAGGLRASIEGVRDHRLPLPIPLYLWYGSDVLLERPDAADLSALTELIPPAAIVNQAARAVLIEIRGRVRFAGGDHDGGAGDLRQAVAIREALGSISAGGGSSPRSALALMLPPSERDEALDLVAAELDDALRGGYARRIGVARRALGLLDPDRDAGLAHLQQAVSVLAGSPACLEHARALVELGAALRRRGDRNGARGPLHEGLDLATRCGADVLSDRARAELASAGARPRRAYTRGRSALSPGELRVAEMAAAGQTSREIAQALFVTTRTVDAHLSHVYTKLGINSRKQLADALAADPT